MKRIIFSASILAVAIAGGVFLLKKSGASERRLLRSTPVVRAKTPEEREAIESRTNADSQYGSNPVAATKAYQKIVADNSTSKDPGVQDVVAESRIRLGYLAAKTGDFHSAREQLLTAAQDYKGTGERVSEFGGLKDQAAYQAAACLSGEGKKEEAKQAFLDFMKTYPTSPLVQAAHTRLRLLNGGQAGDEADTLLQEDLTAQQKAARFESSVCGPKAISELLVRLKKPSKSYEEIAKLCGTTEHGTTIEGMREGLKKVGFRTFALVVNRKDFSTLPTPCLWLNGDHYYLLLSVSEQRAKIFDPSWNAEKEINLPVLDDVHFQAPIIALEAPSFLKGNPS